MRTLTSTQAQVLERITTSAAGQHATVVGWAGGPVLRIRKRLYVITEAGTTESVNELAISNR